MNCEVILWDIKLLLREYGTLRHIRNHRKSVNCERIVVVVLQLQEIDTFTRNKVTTVRESSYYENNCILWESCSHKKPSHYCERKSHNYERSRQLWKLQLVVTIQKRCIYKKLLHLCDTFAIMRNIKYNMGTVVQQTTRPYSGQWTLPERSSEPLSPPSWTFSLHDAPAKPTVSWRTPPTPPTVSSSSYHQEDVPEHQSPLRQTAQQNCPEPKSPPPPSETPCKPLPPETWTVSPTHKPPPQPYHIKGKNCLRLFLCYSKCATHRWVGLYQPPAETHSPLFALDTFHTLLCVHNPKKDSIIYVCLHAHALQIILYCSPASCLTHNVSLCTCKVFMWSIRIVCIFCIF